MSEHVYFATLGLIVGAVLLIFGMRYSAAALQAKARLASELAYRQLAESAVAGQSGTVSALARIEQTLADLTPRVAAVEKMLKDVG